MPIEIERKFLVATDDWRAAVERSESIAQGYLVGAQALRAGHARASVRVRLEGERLPIEEMRRRRDALHREKGWMPAESAPK